MSFHQAILEVVLAMGWTNGRSMQQWYATMLQACLRLMPENGGNMWQYMAITNHYNSA